jgi:hypothetical protein
MTTAEIAIASRINPVTNVGQSSWPIHDRELPCLDGQTPTSECPWVAVKFGVRDLLSLVTDLTLGASYRPGKVFVPIRQQDLFLWSLKPSIRTVRGIRELT